MNFDGSVRIKVGIIALVIFSLLPYLNLVRRTLPFDSHKIFNSEAIQYEKRFSKIKTFLPKVGIVGYIGDDQNALANRTTRQAFILTRYTLSPLIVGNNQDHTLVVGNFSDYSEHLELQPPSHLIKVKDFGNGLILFRKE